MEGRFRQELFYRLNVIELRVPSLRERIEDLPQLAEALLARIAHRESAPVARLSGEAIEALRDYPFPGNVRELENILERAVALSGGADLQVSDLMLPQMDLPDEPPPAPAVVEAGVPDDTAPDGVPPDLQAYVDGLEREAIAAALEKTRHNRTAAAQLLGITFRQLRYRMQRLGVK